MPDTLRYDIVDVFTDRPFAGNPLAVVHGGHDLDDDQMLAIATEFNLSETTFPVPLSPDERSAGVDYKVRIFTPGQEIPFAGHPTLGTAWVLSRTGRLGAGRRVQLCGAGHIDVNVPDDPDGPVELSATPRDPARRMPDDEVAELLALAGLTDRDVAGPAFTAGTGLTWCYLQVGTDALGRARPSGRRVSETGIDLRQLRDPVDGVDVFALDGAAGQGPDDLEIRSRVFVPGYGIPEDPATGSAAAGLGVALVAAGLAAGDGETSYRIQQGVEMGRPSLLRGRVEAVDGVAGRVHVAGQVRHVASGTIAVPPAIG